MPDMMLSCDWVWPKPGTPGALIEALLGMFHLKLETSHPIETVVKSLPGILAVEEGLCLQPKLSPEASEPQMYFLI